MSEVEKMWNELEEKYIAIFDELSLITDIIGYSEETMLKVLYARTGFRNFEQLKESEGE